MTTYCSDALEEAMMLAQTKAINSYSFRDCLNYLNYIWRDIYYRISIADEGYYSKTVKLTQKLTKLPEFVMNTVQVYNAPQAGHGNRKLYRSSGYNDLNAKETYHISGFDLYCPDAIYKNIWLTYTPQPKQLFFTKNSRDPKIFTEEQTPAPKMDYNLYTMSITQISGTPYKVEMIHKDANPDHVVDVTEIITSRGEMWEPKFISCDYPYVWVSYKHTLTGEYNSFIIKDILGACEANEYNPFAFTGRNSNVEFIKTWWNDYTGMGVIILDHADNQYKEMGWTPDTELCYPVPEMYRLFVAKLADKFAAFNESEVMGVSNELASAQYAFDVFLRKDKSSWGRINNVNSPTLGDML